MLLPHLGNQGKAIKFGQHQVYDGHIVFLCQGPVEAILSVMEKVVASMKRVEGFTEIVNRLRAVLKIQTESADEAVRTYRREIDKIFEDIPPEEGSKQ